MAQTDTVTVRRLALFWAQAKKYIRKHSGKGDDPKRTASPAKGIIVHRAIPRGAKAGDRYYFHGHLAFNSGFHNAEEHRMAYVCMDIEDDTMVTIPKDYASLVDQAGAWGTNDRDPYSRLYDMLVERGCISFSYEHLCCDTASPNFKIEYGCVVCVKELHFPDVFKFPARERYTVSGAIDHFSNMYSISVDVYTRKKYRRFENKDGIREPRITWVKDTGLRNPFRIYPICRGGRYRGIGTEYFVRRPGGISDGNGRCIIEKK